MTNEKLASLLNNALRTINESLPEARAYLDAFGRVSRRYRRSSVDRAAVAYSVSLCAFVAARPRLGAGK